VNYEKLRTFITVSEKKSFSEAARVLFLSQPTITSHIKSLEEHLKTTLFERSTKQVELTQSARVLYKYAKDIIKLIENAEKEVISMSDTVYGDLLVACSLTIGENILPQVLGAFKIDFPLIQVSIDITNTNQILTKIKDRVYDIGLIEAPVEDPDVILEPFLEDELVLIASPNYFEKDKISLYVEELLEHPLILRERGSGTRTVMNQHLLKAGVNPEQLQIYLELGSTEAVKSAVEAGLGISIISKSAIKKELKLGILETFPIKDITFSRYFYIVYHRDAILKSTVEVFLKQVKKINPLV
jgi:DNA-binding transcriptional LysR family regulator